MGTTQSFVTKGGHENAAIFISPGSNSETYKRGNARTEWENKK